MYDGILIQSSDFLRSTQKFAQSSSFFGHLLSKLPKHVEDFFKFCAFLRKSKLNLEKQKSFIPDNLDVVT